ncbi:hypothetical protein G3T14_22735 [Methylobacterium sp. BTF04]|uniref:hypothetical protein n=1 Tax=Methylobacterium sp. BTF04 TaxID=2708300 RepID=UPI0013D39501|nr:hypothetical protein [Methylobacterium sp. BTF04]NEU14877.1 hypothetical protein [Methylobacterium sp. BTF04]
MHVEDMAAAIGRAHGAALDEVTRALWAGVAAGEIGDEDAGRLAEAIQARRAMGRSFAACPQNLPVGQVMVLPRPGENPTIRVTRTVARKPQRPPVRSEAIERRRRLAASGPMPPALAARFTTGELAVLRIVVDEAQSRGACVLCLDAIAARAGVSRTLAKNAIKQARRLGMVEVRERRRTGAKSLPNVVTVIDQEWLAWMKRGRIGSPNRGDQSKFGSIRTSAQNWADIIGGRKSTTADTKGLREGGSGLVQTSKCGAGADKRSSSAPTLRCKPTARSLPA